jgi:predicted nuclease of predicted toxin-antitoxin system
MKFLLDVNAGGSLARWLLDRGHDVRLVSEIDPGLEDLAVLQWGLREDRIIVTTDQDFEELVWREGKEHRGIVRLENLPRSERLRLFAYVLDQHPKDLESRAIVIAGSKKIRIRRP